ncbi:MAG: hypothetical protein Q9216_002449 [Gyalolechia sp. 2 TL-2023]
MAWNEPGLFPTGSSIFSSDKASTTSTARLNNPTLLLFQRMNELSIKILSSHPTRKHVVALNRRLGELEGIISKDGFAGDDDGATMDEGLGLLGVVESPEQYEEESNQPPTISFPDSTGPATDIKERSQFLTRVGEAMRQLQRRQEETKELHDHAVSVSERAAKQARRAEAQNEDLINNLMDEEAELNYLKLKLRILEIQMLPHIPPHDYDRLAAGIQRWKSDWGEVHRRQKRRRWERGLDGQEDSSHWLKEGEKGNTDA